VGVAVAAQGVERDPRPAGAGQHVEDLVVLAEDDPVAGEQGDGVRGRSGGAGRGGGR